MIARATLIALLVTTCSSPRMRAQRSGAIVQISSQGGQIAAPGFSAYCAAKFALEGLSEAVAAEVAPFGIRVLIVEPGSFRTELLGRGLSAAAVMEEYASTAANQPLSDVIDSVTLRGDPCRR